MKTLKRFAALLLLVSSLSVSAYADGGTSDPPAPCTGSQCTTPNPPPNPATSSPSVSADSLVLSEVEPFVLLELVGNLVSIPLALIG